jgi:hypothetical protein
VARPGQGEALVVWGMWGLMSLVVLVTYSRLDPSDLYNVSREGLGGGLGRSVVLLNFPIVFVAVALALVAVATLPGKAWFAAGPVIASCVLVPWIVDEDDLDVRPANAIPALGVAIALVLTLAAARRAGTGFARWRAGDRVRIGIAVLVLLLSLPWISAGLGFHFPGDLFMGEEPYPEPDGTVIDAVHLGHHHGMDGSLLVLTVLLLSRVRVPQRGLRLALTGYLGLMFSYGAVNLVQDLWLEQVVKRGWTDERIPSALLPGVRPIWLVILLLAAAATLVLLRERERSSPVTPASYSVP